MVRQQFIDRFQNVGVRMNKILYGIIHWCYHFCMNIYASLVCIWTDMTILSVESESVTPKGSRQKLHTLPTFCSVFLKILYFSPQII